MLDTILIVLLVLGVFRGLKRGLILQFFHLTGFFIAFFIAVYFYDNLAGHLEMLIPYPRILAEDWAFFSESLSLENAYYNMIAFAILFFAAKVIVTIISSMLDFVAELPVLNIVNGISGAVLGFIEMYLVLFVAMYVASLLPVTFVQEWLVESDVSRYMIEQTPILSEKIKTLWFEHIINN